MSVLVSGSVAIDHVKTPHDEHENLLGGSASFAGIAASIFSPVNLMGIVGKDFPQKHIELFKSRHINLEGVQFSDGDTFRWSGEYFGDMNTRKTLDVALNVLESYTPQLPESYNASRIVLLANDSPDNQHSILDQMAKRPDFVIADTMDLWITVARERLIELLPRLDLLVLNDGEAKLLLDAGNLVEAGHRLLDMGPRFVIIKKGEHGALLFGKNRFFTCGAYPLLQLHDPTGAGDSFIGGMAGYLSSLEGAELDFDHLTGAVARGTVVAGYSCESFSTHRLLELTNEELATRLEEFREYSTFS